MEEKITKSNNGSEQKPTSPDLKNHGPDASHANGTPTEKACSKDTFKTFLRKGEKDDGSEENIRYNFISKRYKAIRDATATGITVSMGGIVVMFSSGILLDSMKLAYSSLYFAAAGIASAMLLAANALYNNHGKQP